jgi:hypothetical protein
MIVFVHIMEEKNSKELANEWLIGNAAIHLFWVFLIQWSKVFQRKKDFVLACFASIILDIVHLPHPVVSNIYMYKGPAHRAGQRGTRPDPVKDLFGYLIHLYFVGRTFCNNSHLYFLGRTFCNNSRNRAAAYRASTPIAFTHKLFQHLIFRK